MEEKPYSNREIVNMFDNLDKKLDNIYKEVKATNGKVANIQKWRERMTGAGWALAGIFTFVVMPVIVWAILTINSLDTVVAEAIDGYQLEIIE